jgi:RNA polymerase sigma-70 factor (ECF subfamily)
VQDTVTTDDDLVRAFRAGDQRAFDELFFRYRSPVWGFFVRRVASTGRAEELAQDTFMTLLRSLPRYAPVVPTAVAPTTTDDRSPFRRYLFASAWNLLSNERRRRHEDPLSGSESGLPAATPDPVSSLWVRRALAGLDEHDREILMLREYEQLSYDEIAALLQIPAGTVRSRLFRARLALRAALEHTTVPAGEGR